MEIRRSAGRREGLQSRGAVHAIARTVVIALTACALLLSFVVPAAARVASAPPSVVGNFPLHAEFTPNDPYFSLQWGLNTIDAPRAWDVTLGSHSVIVGVVDTGVWYMDGDIAPNMWNNTDLSHGWNFITNNNNPIDSDNQGPNPVYHGTGVAGVIGAVTNNRYLISGVSQSSIMALAALGPNGEGSSTNTSLAIRWAVDHGARIINLSLGTNTTFIGPTDISLAINYAWSKGALVIAAAGNSGSTTLDYPAVLPNVLAVGAVDQTGTRAQFSNYGTGLSLMAPGVTIWTLTANNGTHALDGTSLATPFVSGVAALLLSVEPTLTNVELWNVLNQTAVPVGTSSYNTQYGWGVVNAWNAINALREPFISVNNFPGSVSKGSGFSIGWSILGPANLPVEDTHVIYGTNPSSLGNATAPQTGMSRDSFTATGLQMPQAASSLYFKVVATVNGTHYESQLYTVGASSLPDFLFVLYQLLSSNLLYLALFILALAAIVAFVPQRRARARRAAYYRARTAIPPTYPPTGPSPGPPPGGTGRYQTATVQTRAVETPAPPIEFVRPETPPTPAAQPPSPPPPMAAPKKRCPNCGTLVNVDNMFCFYCGHPFQ